MTAEELLVERFVKLEKKCEELQEVIEDLQEVLCEKRAEIEEYEKIVDLLQNHYKSGRFGFSFDFGDYEKEYDICVEQLSAYFDLDGETDDERSE